MDTLWQDLRYAARQLARRPGFTAIAVLTLALGIGASTAVFSVVNSILLRPLSYRSPDQLVMVWERNSARPRDRNVVNPANYLDWNDRATSFTGLAAFTWSQTTFTGEDPENVDGRAVTPNFFSVLGLNPTLGRVFTAEEALPGGPPVILLSDGLWRRRFGADSGVVGRAVPIAGGTAVVVGVMPPALRPLPWGSEEYWEPFRLDAGNRVRSGRYAQVIGRLRPGVTLDRAQADMSTIARDLEREHPEFDTGWGATVLPLAGQVVGSARQALLVLLGAVSLVLLIACANVGNLMLARAEGRRREFAVRTALGAPRWRLVRQWLLESGLIAVAGGGAGLLLAAWAVDLLVVSGPHSLPRLAEIGLDTRVLWVAGFVSLATGALVGLPAALGGVGGSLAAGRESVRVTTDARAARLRNGMVVVQVSLALVLLAGAGLLVRSLQHLMAIDPGFDPRQLLSATVTLPRGTYPDGARGSAFYARLLERVRGLPGVTAAGAVDFIPLAEPTAATRFTIVGRPAPVPGQWTSADIRVIDPGYFAAMGIPLLRGRAPTVADGATSPPIVVINETMARRYWPDADPIGQRLQVNWTHPEAHPEIVGVVGNVHLGTVDSDFRPMIYYVQAQDPSGSMTLVLRHTGGAAPLTTALRATVRELDPNLPLTDVATMSSRLVQSTADRRYPMLLLSVFAALAVVLAAIGLYGVLSYTVSRRTREIGVRIALGAQGADVLRLVVGGGMRLTLIGIVVGLAGAALAARALGHLLYGVTASDPVTLAGVAVLLSAVALLAAYLPARRAARLDPVVALRTE